MEAELVKVQKLESLGVLAGGIAHDFNNILTAILGNISLAKMHRRSPEKAAARLTEAEKACLQAQGLTQQLLTFSKGGAPIKETVNIVQLTQDSCNFAVRGSNVRCELAMPDDLAAVDVDQGQIGQVINNLVINAVHAMPQGGVIQVEAENVRVTSHQGLPLKNGKYAKIVVRDHGVGIPESILRRIFDPYFTTKHKGSGLGLATSFSIIQNHDGLITVESEVGVGTTFHVYLPVSQKELRTSTRSEELVAEGGGKVLLMDDEDSVRQVATEMLCTLGYEVEVARDGAEAIDLYRSAKGSSRAFHVVILDLTVPDGMGGAEAIEKLREIDPEIKAVVSSGYSNDPIMAEYAKYGFSGVVAKPYTAKHLSATLRQVMARP
jgi:CheY-like chemotaxis protein